MKRVARRAHLHPPHVSVSFAFGFRICSSFEDCITLPAQPLVAAKPSEFSEATLQAGRRVQSNDAAVALSEYPTRYILI